VGLWWVPFGRRQKVQNGHAIILAILKIPPLFSDLDRRRRIPLNEVAEVIGFDVRRLRRYAIEGIIPGAKQLGPRKHWTFDRHQLETWWQAFNLEPVKVAAK
jgi:hypothetical protein